MLDQVNIYTDGSAIGNPGPGGYGIIMEWNNPRSAHPEWENDWRYAPQKAVGSNDKMIPLLWADSIAFQKFQRYVHGEYKLKEYVKYLESHAGESDRYFPIYSNDVEIFDKSTVLTLGGQSIRNLSARIDYKIKYGEKENLEIGEFDFSTSDQPVVEKRIFKKAFENFLRKEIYRFRSLTKCEEKS